MLQPYWSPSNGDGPETRGAIIGFNEEHTSTPLSRNDRGVNLCTKGEQRTFGKTK